MVCKELIEGLTDDFVTYAMTIAVLYMVVMGIVVPDFIVGAYGMILIYYFQK